MKFRLRINKIAGICYTITVLRLLLTCVKFRGLTPYLLIKNQLWSRDCGFQLHSKTASKNIGIYCTVIIRFTVPWFTMSSDLLGVKPFPDFKFILAISQMPHPIYHVIWYTMHKPLLVIGPVNRMLTVFLGITWLQNSYFESLWPVVWILYIIYCMHIYRIKIIP